VAAAVLELTNLAHAFGGMQAVDGVSFSVPQGVFWGLIGPNGAGKTTLIDCVSGVHDSYKGQVSFDGRDITGWPLHRVARLGLSRSFQVSRIFGRMTVLSNLMAAPPAQHGERLARSFLGGWQEQEQGHLQRAWQMLKRFSIGDVADNYGTDLSGGQRRLTELSRGLMTGLKMLLLDEPFAGISPTNRARLAEDLTTLCREEGITILMIEHRLELVEQLCDHIIVMAEGKVIARGSMADLRQNAAVVAAYLGGEVASREA